MATAKNLSELTKELQNVVTKAIQQTDHVIEEVISTGQRHVDSDVYDAYQPKMYERTGQLREDWDAENITNGVAIINTRRDEDTGRYIPSIIESGKGYDWSGYGYAYEMPRPFMYNTWLELKSTNALKEALRKSLHELGVKTL